MKSILILLLIPCFCFGQQETLQSIYDSTFVIDSTVIKIRPIDMFPIGKDDSIFLQRWLSENTYDTVKTLLLVFDTSTHFVKVFKHVSDTSDFWITGTDTIIDKRIAKSTDFYWQYGYEVREVFCCTNGNHTNLSYYQAVPYYQHIEYLDADRKPLNRNIIVWQSKNL